MESSMKVEGNRLQRTCSVCGMRAEKVSGTFLHSEGTGSGVNR